MTQSDSRPAHYACLGIGVGPANLSLAALLHRHPGIPHLFLDRKAEFGWHEGQLVSGAELQVSPLKDLVTLHDPTNPWSFLNYLHDQGRIYHFLNARFDSVPRREYRNYLEWASRRNPRIVFGEEVLAVDFDTTFTVHTSKRVLTADNIVAGVGTTPWVPYFARDQLGRNQFHVADFGERAASVGGRRVVVIGGGQSGAEAVLDLLSRRGPELPRELVWVSRRRNFFPIDDSPFTNEFFMPCHADHFYGLEPATRAAFNREQNLASDGISERTARELYQRLYLHRFVERREEVIGLYPNRDVVDVTRVGEQLMVAVRHRDETDLLEHFETDLIVWATGYRPAALDFLAPLADRLERDGAEYAVDADFAVRWDGPPDRNIFLQNAVRGQRGLADPNLSLNAWRSGRIIDRIRGERGRDQLAAFVEWSTKPGKSLPS
ncbi:lysine N(6)-hydroxylase/L-ornithine N(5)-oxygenase family protein [Nocardia inohanensis]|uniref:lysine N(6)-hydroxylase/L-ornithine N(5)-oxygenase family protein n=1 Tax=Nocardia inohanensis TaxID=209246 RepID=UPI00082BEFDC|nr:SidA/IucD/PvdA family monooxygenase [Nocardia inohanensis]